MKNIKFLLGSACVIALVVVAVLLYRRTNMLMSHFRNLTQDLNSVKSFLTKNMTPPQNIRGSGVAVSRTPASNLQPEEEENKIHNTQHNIDTLTREIAEIQNMMSSSSESETEELGEETESDIGSIETDADIDGTLGDTDDDNSVNLEEQTVETQNLESYDLVDVDENSELENLLNPGGQDEKNSAEKVPEKTVEYDVELEQEESKQVDIKSNSNNITDEITEDLIINRYTKRELEKLCSQKYISKSGNKAVLVRRLIENKFDFSIYKINVVQAVSQN